MGRHHAKISHQKGSGFPRNGPALVSSLCMEANAGVGLPQLGHESVMLLAIIDVRDTQLMATTVSFVHAQ